MLTVADRNVHSMDFANVVKTASKEDGFNLVVYNKRWKQANGRDRHQALGKNLSRPERQDRQVIVGSGNSHHSIKVVPRGKDNQSSVFVSRLDPETSVNTLSEHVFSTTKLKLKGIKLRSRYDTYASFRIFAPNNEVDKLLVPSIWPKGAIVRQFY